MPGGRPTKLTKAVHDAIVGSVENGNYRDPSVRAAGIGMTTFHRWMEQAEADEEHGRDSPHRRLREAVLQAEATAEQNAVKIVLDAAHGGTWQAAAWWLERRKPDQWAKRERVTMDAAVQSTVTAEVEIIHNKPVLVIPAPDRREQVARIYHDAVNGGGSAN